jgi:signal peptide peptidase SppA
MVEPYLGNIVRLLSDPKALEASRPFKVLRAERLGILDGVGRLYIEGPLFKRDSALTRLFGFSTYEMLRRDLQAALDNAEIEAIALHVDSPGGDANGCDELAQAIFDARKKKPIAAYISGAGCSAAYWLASATSRVTASDAAMVGSVGVVLGITDRKKSDEKRGVTHTEFVSSQSPGKRPDIATSEGRERIQKMVDQMGEVFVSAIAKQRGVAKEKVHSWQGGVEIGAKAKAAGMIDAVGSFEDVLAWLKKQPVPINAKPVSAAPAPAPAAQRVVISAPPAIQPSAAELARAKAAADAEAQELARIKAIFQSPIGRRLPERASYFAYETTMTAKAAIDKMKQEATNADWSAAVKQAQCYT